MRYSLAVFLSFSLAACSLFGSKPDATPEKIASVEEMYQVAKTDLDDKSYEEAIKHFESLQSHFPYGRYAQQAQLEIAYAYYKQQEPELAIAAANRFIKQYPKNQNVDYAYYVKGLANFNAEIGIFGSAFGQDSTERDPKAAQDSFAALKDLVTRYPTSKYVPDSKLRMQYLLSSLAKYDVHVASYYLRRQAYIAAINRAKEILTAYPKTPSTHEALQIMIKGYDALGLTTLRDDAQRVLDLNFPKTSISPVAQAIE